MIDKETVNKMADLAMLKVSKEEELYHVINMNYMLEKVDIIKEVDTEGVKPNYNVNEGINALREDVITESLDREDVVKNTKEEQYGYFKILNVLD